MGRRTMGRLTPGSWARCWVEATAEDATVAGGRDKPHTRGTPGLGSLVWRISSVEVTTTTAAATVDINPTTPKTTIPTTTIPTTIIPTTTFSSSASVTTT